LSLAEKQQATVPLIMGHRLMGASLLHTGDLAEGRAHYAQALALYDPAEQRPLVARFGGVDIRVAILANRSIGLWPLGYPEAALADAETGAPVRARGKPSSKLDVCSALHIDHLFVLRELRCSKSAR
jgi:hypothetical protein